MNSIKLFAAMGVMAFPMSLMAQKGVDLNDPKQPYGHGQDSVVCIENLVKYGDMVKIKNYKEAYEPWKIVFEQCPLAKGTTLYLDGVKIAKDLIVKDKANQESYYTLLMSIYDQRAKYYGNNKNYPTSYLMGQKAVDMLSYKKGDKAVRDEAVTLLDQALKGDPSTIQTIFVQKYMQQVVEQYKDGKASGEDVVNAYLRCSDILPKVEAAFTEKAKNPKTQKTAQQVLDGIPEAKEYVEGIFAASGAADCETISKIFSPMLAEHTTDADWLKKINKLLGDCTDSELYYAISESLHKIDPQASSARGLAKMYLKQKNVEQAIAYYNEAINLETDDKLKSKYYYELGLVNFADGNLSAAKSAAKSAAGLRDDWGDPYILLAKIYAQGAGKIGEKAWEKQAPYWAAYDKALKAKNIDQSESVQKEASSLMSTFAQHFPSKDDLFFDGIKDGTSYTVGGFIGEATTVRARK